MLTREFAHAGHVTRFTITRSSIGWDVREERDDRTVRRMNYTDWHRVERAIQVFELAERRAETDDPEPEIESEETEETEDTDETH